MKAIRGRRFEVIFLVTLCTGLRRGEVCGLTWDCVDLEHGTIHVNKQLQQIPGQSGNFRLTPTKNGKGRTITAASFVVDALRQYKVQQTEARLKAGPDWQDEGFVFTDEVGHRLSPNTVYHNYKRIVASIGLPEARLHDLRHPNVKPKTKTFSSFLEIFAAVSYAHISMQKSFIFQTIST